MRSVRNREIYVLTCDWPECLVERGDTAQVVPDDWAFVRVDPSREKEPWGYVHLCPKHANMEPAFIAAAIVHRVCEEAWANVG